MKKGIKNTLIIIILFISIAGVILPRRLNDLDEIWNYNFARCIANGLLPYKDFNMVQTPLLPIICGTILKLTFNELFIMRILAVILMTMCLFVIYKILEILNIHTYIVKISIIGIYLLLYKYFCIDYNFCVLLIILFVIYIEIKNKKEKIMEAQFKHDFLLGILVGTSILFKQTTGLALILVFTFYKILLANKKQDFKTGLNIIISRTYGVLIPIGIFLIYLAKNNIWKDFLNYTVYSLNTFSNKISYIYLLNGSYGVVLQILSIIIPSTILIMYYLAVFKKHTTKEQENIFILFCYSVASLIVVYPISDNIHFLIGAAPSLIALIYLTYIVTKKLIEKSANAKQLKFEIKCFIKAFGYLSIIVIMTVSVYNLIKYIKVAYNYKDLKHFKYIPTSIESIKNVDNYILEQNINGKKVYILDANAAIYMIPIDKYNKDYDMFLKGNLGVRGEERTNRKTKKRK